MGSWTASFAARLLLIYRWTPFWAVSGRDPSKRGPPPHQLRPLPFSRRWTLFCALSGRHPPKRGPPPHQLRPLPFSRRWTPFEPWAAEMLQKGGHRHISSDLSIFPGAGPLFEPWEAGILHKGELQPDVKLGGFNFVSSFAQGKCIASLQEDPAADSLYLGCFCCATTMQRLELDLRFCDRKLDCFFCWSASPYLPLDPFLRRVRPRSSKKGATATSAQTLTFFQALDPFLSRERPRSSKKGPPPHQLRSFNFPGAGPLFEPWEAGILHKGELQPDV